MKTPKTILIQRVLSILFLIVGGGLAVIAVAGPPVLPPLNPPPPSFEVCKPSSGAICRGETGFTLDQEPTGIICGTAQNPVELLESGTDVTRATRYYDAAGNLTRRVEDFDFEGTIINPVTGLTAKLKSITDIVDTLSVPGDFSSATERQTGPFQITMPGHGVLLLDTGRIFFDVEGDLVLNGHHALFDYFNGDSEAVAELCSALGSPGTP